MRSLFNLILNRIWFLLAGFWLFLGYMVATVIMFVLIVTIPWGIAASRIGFYALWPFGRDVVDRHNIGVGTLLGNVIWLLLAGWWLALEHIVTGVLLCVTIIGIPMGIANFKMVPIALLPMGKRIVNRQY